MRELTYCFFLKKLFILYVFCGFNASLFATISVFSFSFDVAYFRSKTDTSNV